MHALMRLVLCWLHLGYRKPKIGAAYYYEMSGPFSDEVIRPTEVINGWVRYVVTYANGFRSDTWTSVSTFAIMCRERAK